MEINMNSKLKRKAGKPSVLKLLLLSLLVVIAAAGITWWMIKTAPRPTVRPRREQAALVEVSRLISGDEVVVIESSGTVIPARRVDLQARVSGQVTGINPSFIPGGRLLAREEILKIDPEDYALVVKRKQAEVTRSEQKYRMELGRQDIAHHEWSILSDRGEATELDRDLALRQPQLIQAQADLSAAWASLSQAELDLARTSVRAPLNSVVIRKDVELGSQVSSSTTIGTLVGTDEFWVSLTLPVADLARFSAGTGEEGARVLLMTTGPGKEETGWEGRVIKKQADLEEKGRLARVIVSIPRPLDNQDHPLLLGMYLAAEIRGRTIPGVFSIPRNALRGSNQVWLINPENRLEMRPVEIVWAGRDRVLVRDTFTTGDRLVVSDLAAPVEGMLLKVIAKDGEDER
jgi:RND family efflux transporter MFP subunit